ncbi:sigma-70 family RNA polymerase sigma factor [Paraburkholderia caribensis]|uniref:RNA polymerase subunit sigma-24 n=1 Tax=Paraburkholderia caribensis TaxID=75105 RepID=A0A9Q6S0L8_9BURK|nr:sigma-70 family RNA polymerase sigma factor [Paraburkholderia caribensis]MCO4882782.1 sigma-70 family RNA polymerase sigma factor [Paraburkholderia caribensis]PTB24798.1 RNA polymerase subunit sigma-24 [Paraburkholderia caribensis]QLB61964.1 RNA polymerase subunit sigma-24 [Paraburkholderia caribensis]
MEMNREMSADFEAMRARLFALAYRMLGSRAEAEDIVQDAWLKWHAADPREVRSPAAWLTTIATHLAIDRLRHLQIERATRSGGWMPEPWIESLAPSAEDLALQAVQMSYGVMLLLERLKPEERAAFVLHEAFDCDYAEIAKILAKTPANCRQMVHRARARLQREGVPAKRADPAAHARIVERLRAAMEAQDRAGLVRLFCEVPSVMSDAAEPVDAVATAEQAATTLSMRSHGDQMETVTMNGMRAVALMRDGEIDALLDISIGEDERIVALRIVTGTLRLASAARVFGRAAVLQLLRPVSSQAASITMRGHFPVDIDA